MNLNNINITEIVEQTKAQLQEDITLTPALKMSIELILVIVVMLAGKLGLNSKNSSIPPSKDINRKKHVNEKSDKSAGGQKGRVGKTLPPGEVKVILVERDFLPKGHYREVGFQKRQVVDIDISKIVTEYQAQILENEHGKRFVDEFPVGVNSPIQYGVGVKAHAVYLSQYQLPPYNRIEEYFSDQLGIPISAGSLFNFNEQAATLVKSSGAEAAIKKALQTTFHALHVDETGINIAGKRRWLHGASTVWWTYFYPHEKIEKIAVDDADILPHFTGVLCHDHWKPYYQYTQCQHALYNAHHIRELERAWEQKGMQGAEMFCLIRSYLSTCRKQDVSASLALELLFKNQLPDIFIEAE